MSRILVVDDEKNICDLLSLYLVKEGFEVEWCRRRHTGA